jgi:hypothetical protein
VGPEGAERYVPYVIEPAVSIERIFVAMLVDAYDEEEVAGRGRTVLRLHPAIAPVKAAVLPLIARDSAMVEKARGLRGLRTAHAVEYDEAARSAAATAARRDRYPLRLHGRRADARGRHGRSATEFLPRSASRSARWRTSRTSCGSLTTPKGEAPVERSVVSGAPRTTSRMFR